jgi:hypothetical protein
MGRLVEATDEPAISLIARAKRETGYAERTAKYIPGEVLAAYVSINSILGSVDAKDQLLAPASWFVFGLCLVVTPLYLRALAIRPEPPWTHLAISTAAFAVWAYALGGPFALSGIQKPWLGSILLILFTLLAGLIEPKKKR